MSRLLLSCSAKLRARKHFHETHNAPPFKYSLVFIGLCNSPGIGLPPYLPSAVALLSVFGVVYLFNNAVQKYVKSNAINNKTMYIH